MTIDKPAYSKVSYILFLFILVWAPLPLGSNRDWALAILMALCLVLYAVMALEAILFDRPLLTCLRPYLLPLALLLLVAVWATLQSLPLPEGIVQWLSPVTAQTYRQVSVPAGTAWISMEPGQTAVQAMYTWVLLLFATCTLLLHADGRRIRTTLLVIVLCGVFQAVYGSFMTLSGLEYGFFYKKVYGLGMATGTFVNRNHLAGYLEMTLAVGIGLLVASLGRQRRGWRNQLGGLLDALLGAKMRLRIFLALMVVTLVLSRSRMGNSAFFFSLPACGMLMMILQRKMHKGAVLLFASLMLVDFLIVGQWFGFDKLAERMEQASVQTDSRDEVLRDTLVMQQDFPLAGTGLGTYYSVYPRYQQRDAIGFFDHAHNDLAEFLTDLGYIGYLPLALLVLYSFYQAVHTLHARKFPLALALAGILRLKSTVE